MDVIPHFLLSLSLQFSSNNKPLISTNNRLLLWWWQWAKLEALSILTSFKWTSCLYYIWFQFLFFRKRKIIGYSNMKLQLNNLKLYSFWVCWNLKYSKWKQVISTFLPSRLPGIAAQGKYHFQCFMRCNTKYPVYSPLTPRQVTLRLSSRGITALYQCAVWN